MNSKEINKKAAINFFSVFLTIVLGMSLVVFVVGYYQDDKRTLNPLSDTRSHEIQEGDIYGEQLIWYTQNGKMTAKTTDINYSLLAKACDEKLSSVTLDDGTVSGDTIKIECLGSTEAGVVEYRDSRPKLVQAYLDAGWEYSQDGERLQITSGPNFLAIMSFLALLVLSVIVAAAFASEKKRILEKEVEENL